MTIKISNFQLVTLFIMARMFNECMTFPSTVGKYGMQHFTIILLSKLVLFILFIPLIIFCKKCPGESIFTIFAKKCRPLFYIFGIWYLLNTVHHCFTLIVSIEFFLTNTIMKTTEAWQVILMMTIVILYGMSRGLQATARMGPILLFLFIVILFVGGGALVKYMDVKYLYPAFVDHTDRFWSDLATEVAKNRELFIFLVLCQHVNSKAERTIYMYLPSILVIVTLMTFLTTIVLGPMLDLTSFPFNMMASLSDVMVLERLDGVDIFIWTAAAIINTVLFCICIRDVLSLMVKERKAKIISQILVALSAVGAYISCINQHVTMWIDFKPKTAFNMLLFAIIGPFVAIWLEKRRSKDEKKAIPQEQS